jgi:hypothetical protein
MRHFNIITYLFLASAVTALVGLAFVFCTYLKGAR